MYNAYQIFYVVTFNATKILKLILNGTAKVLKHTQSPHIMACHWHNDKNLKWYATP